MEMEPSTSDGVVVQSKDVQLVEAADTRIVIPLNNRGERLRGSLKRLADAMLETQEVMSTTFQWMVTDGVEPDDPDKRPSKAICWSEMRNRTTNACRDLYGQKELINAANRVRIGASLDELTGHPNSFNPTTKYWMFRLVMFYHNKDPVESPGTISKVYSSDLLTNIVVFIGEVVDVPTHRSRFQECLLMFDGSGEIPTRKNILAHLNQRFGSHYYSVDLLCPCNNWILYLRVNVWPKQARNVIASGRSWRSFMDTWLTSKGVSNCFVEVPTIRGLSAAVAVRVTEKQWLKQDELIQVLINDWLECEPYMGNGGDVTKLEKQILAVLC